MNLKRMDWRPLAVLLAFSVGSTVYGMPAQAAPHSVTVTWHATTAEKGSAPLRYNIYRSEDGGQSYVCIAQKVQDTTYLDSNVKAGKSYSYEVTSVDEKGHESARSAPIKATVPH